jgi:hypothetical protein
MNRQVLVELFLAAPSLLAALALFTYPASGPELLPFAIACLTTVFVNIGAALPYLRSGAPADAFAGALPGIATGVAALYHDLAALTVANVGWLVVVVGLAMIVKTSKRG